MSHEAKSISSSSDFSLITDVTQQAKIVDKTVKVMR